jgi:hypothetical protein
MCVESTSTLPPRSPRLVIGKPVTIHPSARMGAISRKPAPMVIGTGEGVPSGPAGVAWIAAGRCGEPACDGAPARADSN